MTPVTSRLYARRATTERRGMRTKIPFTSIEKDLTITIMQSVKLLKTKGFEMQWGGAFHISKRPKRKTGAPSRVNFRSFKRVI